MNKSCVTEQQISFRGSEQAEPTGTEEGAVEALAAEAEEFEQEAWRIGVRRGNRDRITRCK